MPEPELQNDGPSFDEFPRPTYEEWYAAVVESLEGASFEKTLTTPTYEGLTIQPLYRQADTQDFSHQHTLPGFPPFVRGGIAAGCLAHPWDIAQELPYSDPASFNTALRHELEHGQTVIHLALDSIADNVSTLLNTTADCAAAFDGMDLTALPIAVEAGTSALPVVSILTACLNQRNQSTSSLRGCVANDPLGVLALKGSLAVEQIYDETAELTRWSIDHAPQIEPLSINTSVYHNSGANAVQELAYGIATGVEYVRAMLKRGLNIDEIAPRTRFFFVIGSHFFMEVAKLRAARILWSQIVDAFGGSAHSQRMRLHTQTSTFNKTAIDPYTNILRTAVESFAGAIGGSESIRVTPFDEPIGLSSDFSRRIARNQQLVLQYETGLTHLIDPAGGSWYLETLTNWLAREAWGLFQNIEKQGGMLAALKAGLPQQQIGDIAARRLANFERRKDALVGVNMYPNHAEEPPPFQGSTHHDSYNAAMMNHSTFDSTQKKEVLEILRTTPQEYLVETAVRAAAAGASLTEIAQAIHSQAVGELAVISPLHPFRLAHSYEALRQNAEMYRARTGNAPRIFLANFGSYRARAGFTSGFFEVGGFEIVDMGAYPSPEAAALAAEASGASAIVICSTDDRYPEIVPPFVQQVKAEKPDMIVILAGYPEDQIAAHRASGVDDFIHIRSNCYEMNLKLQKLIGVSV